ncbi:MAG: hypothetical protein GY882_00220 [Actinomycetia bacterium]|nr:hypothetical protein [Actinomycetes bacterium]
MKTPTTASGLIEALVAMPDASQAELRSRVADIATNASVEAFVDFAVDHATPEPMADLVVRFLVRRANPGELADLLGSPLLSRRAYDAIAQAANLWIPKDVEPDAALEPSQAPRRMLVSLASHPHAATHPGFEGTHANLLAELAHGDFRAAAGVAQNPAADSDLLAALQRLPGHVVDPDIHRHIAAHPNVSTETLVALTYSPNHVARQLAATLVGTADPELAERTNLGEIKNPNGLSRHRSRFPHAALDATYEDLVAIADIAEHDYRLRHRIVALVNTMYPPYAGKDAGGSRLADLVKRQGSVRFADLVGVVRRCEPMLAGICARESTPASLRAVADMDEAARARLGRVLAADTATGNNNILITELADVIAIAEATAGMPDHAAVAAIEVGMGQSCPLKATKTARRAIEA